MTLERPKHYAIPSCRHLQWISASLVAALLLFFGASSAAEPAPRPHRWLFHDAVSQTSELELCDKLESEPWRDAAREHPGTLYAVLRLQEQIVNEISRSTSGLEGTVFLVFPTRHPSRLEVDRIGRVAAKPAPAILFGKEWTGPRVVRSDLRVTTDLYEPIRFADQSRKPVSIVKLELGGSYTDKGTTSAFSFSIRTMTVGRAGRSGSSGYMKYCALRDRDGRYAVAMTHSVSSQSERPAE